MNYSKEVQLEIYTLQHEIGLVKNRHLRVNMLRTLNKLLMLLEDEFDIQSRNIIEHIDQNKDNYILFTDFAKEEA